MFLGQLSPGARRVAAPQFAFGRYSLLPTTQGGLPMETSVAMTIAEKKQSVIIIMSRGLEIRGGGSASALRARENVACPGRGTVLSAQTATARACPPRRPIPPRRARLRRKQGRASPAGEAKRLCPRATPGPSSLTVSCRRLQPSWGGLQASSDLSERGPCLCSTWTRLLPFSGQTSFPR